MYRGEKERSFARVLFMIACITALAAGSAPAGTVINIDLTQAGVESTRNVRKDTWRWGRKRGPAMAFDLEFSSGSGAHLDLDGGSRAGNEFFTGSESLTNHTYDTIQASYLGGSRWQINALRGSTLMSLGTVNEFSGPLSHADNYAYRRRIHSSNPEGGPDDAGAKPLSRSRFKSWFWIYRASDETVSLNIVVGSGKGGKTPRDNGQFRADLTFVAPFQGNPALLVRNDPRDRVSPTTFSGDWRWRRHRDDGGSFGGIVPVGDVDVDHSGTPLVVPEPATMLLLGLGCIPILKRRRAE